MSKSDTTDRQDAKEDLAYAHGYAAGWNNALKEGGIPPTEAMKNRTEPALKILVDGKS